MNSSITPMWRGAAFRRSIATTLLASTSIGFALPTAVDSFLTGGANYSVGNGNLIGQGPAATGFTGTWLGNGSPDVIGTGLTYSTVPNAGGAIEYPSSSSGRTGRLLTSPYGNASSGTVYYGVMLQLSSIDNGYRGLELHTGSFSDDSSNRRLQIVAGGGGTGAPEDHFGVRVNGNGSAGFIGDLGPIDTNVNFFIVKVSFSATAGQDVVSIWRNPTDLSSEAGSGAAGFISTTLDFAFDRVSFACFSNTGYKADEIRIGNAWTDVTTAVSNADTDNDGLPDVYEQVLIDVSPTDGVSNLSHVKGPLDAPTTSDFDGDDSSDAQEFARGTNPNNTDSDGDGLQDGPETKTGVFVSALNTGSDPLDNDSDNDTLIDGLEVTLYGTNPNIADTDGDGESDGVEVAQGSNPTSASSNSLSLGIATVDGTRDDSLYSTPLAVQTVNTTFGDNVNEWNAAYAYVNGGKLYLIFTGNLETSFNKLEIFIDSKAGGSSTFNSVPGNDGAENMNGMKFDISFTPDYHLIARRGDNKLDLNFANLATPAFSSYSNVLGGSDFGSGSTGTGTNTVPIRVGYNGSNNEGIAGGTEAADPVAAAAVTTGLELAIDLADLGSPTGAFKVMLLQNNQNHSFVSNQSLGGLPASFGNLAAPATIDFSAYAGDQFFSVDPSPIHLLAGGTALRFTAKGLTAGTSYIVQESTSLINFMDVPNSQFIATGAVQVITLPVAPGTDPKRFFRVRSAP